MAGNNIIPGFIWAIVSDNKDPEGIGRIKVKVKDLWDNQYPEWVVPIGWPGAGGDTGARGSKYVVPIGAQVAMFFDQGDPSVTPAYLPGPYGAPDGTPLGPALTAEAHANPDLDELDYQIIWEDEYFRFFVVTKEDDRRFEIFEKKSGSHIIMNATDGESNKSCTIAIKATTSIDIESKGAIKLDAAQVQIQGRVVQRKPGVTTI